MKLGNKKFRISSPEHSEALQKHLLENNFSWAGRKEIKHLDSDFLYTDNIGYITYGGDEEYFERNPREELTVELITTIALSKVVKRETVELFGRTYFKDELEAALTTLATAK